MSSAFLLSCNALLSSTTSCSAAATRSCSSSCHRASSWVTIATLISAASASGKITPARASQTAEIVAERLGIELKIDTALAHGFNVERLRRLLGKADSDCIMVVGHEPEFSEVIKDLTGGEVKLSKAGVALLEVNRGCTSGKLLWLFPPKFSKAAL